MERSHEENKQSINNEYHILYLNKKFRDYLGIDERSNQATMKMKKHLETKNMVQHFFKTKKFVKSAQMQR